MLSCGQDGLSAAEAAQRLKQYGENEMPNSDGSVDCVPFCVGSSNHCRSSFLAIGVVSIATGDAIGGVIIGAILAVSIGLDTFQEGHAEQAAEVLRCSVALKAEVKRDGSIAQVPVETVVTGDLIRVRAGDIIPADALVLTTSACTVNERR